MNVIRVNHILIEWTTKCIKYSVQQFFVFVFYVYMCAFTRKYVIQKVFPLTYFGSIEKAHTIYKVFALSIIRNLENKIINPIQEEHIAIVSIIKCNFFFLFSYLIFVQWAIMFCCWISLNLVACVTYGKWISTDMKCVYCLFDEWKFCLVILFLI